MFMRQGACCGLGWTTPQTRCPGMPCLNHSPTIHTLECPAALPYEPAIMYSLGWATPLPRLWLTKPPSLDPAQQSFSRS